MNFKLQANGGLQGVDLISAGGWRTLSLMTPSEHIQFVYRSHFVRAREVVIVLRWWLYHDYTLFPLVEKRLSRYIR